MYKFVSQNDFHSSGKNFLTLKMFVFGFCLLKYVVLKNIFLHTDLQAYVHIMIGPLKNIHMSMYVYTHFFLPVLSRYLWLLVS